MRQLGMLGLVAFGLASATESLAAPKPPLVLEPTTKWTIDYSPENCRLLRGFGPESDRVTLTISQNGPGKMRELMVTGKMFYSREVTRSVVAGFSPGPVPEAEEVTTATIGSSKLPALLISDSNLDVGDDATVPARDMVQDGPMQFKIDGPGFRSVALQLGPMKAALNAMRKCTDALMKEWGYDPVQQSRLARPLASIGRPADWISGEDYPKDALLKRSPGFVYFRLAVDEHGSPQKCVIQRETNPALFGDVSCKLIMERAKFTPALDESGKAIPSYFVSRVRWMIVP